LNLPWQIPDRDGLGFDSNLQIATVLTSSGQLVLPQDVALPSAGLSVELIKSNASSFVVSDTGIQNVLIANSNSGWQYTIASPNPITSNIDPIFNNSTGAQVILEFTLSQPSSCSQIQITPLASETIDIVDVIAYSSINDRVGFSLRGTSNVQVNQSQTISFPLTTIQRFRVFLNQSEYTRTLSTHDSQDVMFNRVYAQSGAADKSVNNLGYDDVDFIALAEGMDNYPTIANTGLTTTQPDIADLLTTFKTKLGPQSQWTQPNPSTDMFLHLYSTWPGVFKTAFTTSAQMPWIQSGSVTPLASVTNNAPPPTSAYPSGTINPTTSTQYNYQYIIGLESIRIGVSIPEYKGVYVSNIIPSPGDMGVVVLNATYDNYKDSSGVLDNPLLTSVEFSVTNTSTPISEKDWVPILPLDDIFVSTERLFPNTSGACALRFMADATEPMYVFRNGYAFTDYTQQLDTSFNNVVGITLLPQSYAPQDVITISYTPVKSSNIVNFAALGFGDLPLLSATDQNGAGEGFTATVGDNTVQLGNIPFVNTAQLNSGVYQPITVTLSDGTTATNLTNYITGVQPVFPTNGYYYIQSNNVLLFNQAISKPFRVYYQYLQNNVRFRAVLRSNSINLVSPIVTLIQVKAETRLPNAVQSL
jgi:hypothetical protein